MQNVSIGCYYSSCFSSISYKVIQESAWCSGLLTKNKNLIFEGLLSLLKDFHALECIIVKYSYGIFSGTGRVDLQWMYEVLSGSMRGIFHSDIRVLRSVSLFDVPF